MKKRNVFSRKTRLNNNSKRRLLLKRVHQKVMIRRQQFQQTELLESFSEAS